MEPIILALQALGFDEPTGEQQRILLRMIGNFIPDRKEIAELKTPAPAPE